MFILLFSSALATAKQNQLRQTTSNVHLANNNVEAKEVEVVEEVLEDLLDFEKVQNLESVKKSPVKAMAAPKQTTTAAVTTTTKAAVTTTTKTTTAVHYPVDYKGPKSMKFEACNISSSSTKGCSAYQAGVKAYSGWEITGSLKTMDAVSWDDCAIKCLSTDDCEVWSHDMKTGTCSYETSLQITGINKCTADIDGSVISGFECIPPCKSKPEPKIAQSYRDESSITLEGKKTTPNPMTKQQCGQYCNDNKDQCEVYYHEMVEDSNGKGLPKTDGLCHYGMLSDITQYSIGSKGIGNVVGFSYTKTKSCDIGKSSGPTSSETYFSGLDNNFEGLASWQECAEKCMESVDCDVWNFDMSAKNNVCWLGNLIKDNLTVNTIPDDKTMLSGFSCNPYPACEKEE